MRSCRSIQKNVWSEMSFLIIVLSQSKTARGRPPGSPEHVPRASITAWMRAALSPYHCPVSLGQAGDWAPADAAVDAIAATASAAAQSRRAADDMGPSRLGRLPAYPRA
jgi:hypothetical protein